METVDAENQEFRWTALMEQSLEGDCASYGELLSSITPALRRAIRTRARQVGLDAEDVVQEVLLALHLKRNTWVRGTPVAPWLAAIARNKIVDAHRRRGRRPEVSNDSVVETLRDEGDVSEDQSQELERGIAGLPERQRQVLHAVSLEGYSAQEAATQLQMSEVGVRVTLHRALKSLAVFFSQGNS
jgi:RNA polymerase sigma-70 factor (ECF subfamily)